MLVIQVRSLLEDVLTSTSIVPPVHFQPQLVRVHSIIHESSGRLCWHVLIVIVREYLRYW